EELARLVAFDVAFFVEQSAGAADIGFGLLHHGHVEKYEGLPQRVIGAEGSHLIGRHADDSRRHPVPEVLAFRSGADIEGVLETTWYRTIVLRREKQHGIAALDSRPKTSPGGGRFAFEILIIEGQIADLLQGTFERFRR